MIIRVPKCLPHSDEFTFTAIDFERANNSSCSVCQIGICVVERGKIKESFGRFVKPPERARYFQKNLVKIHGITPEDVEDAPTFGELWDEIRRSIVGRPLVAHSFRDDSRTFASILSCYHIDYQYRRFGYLCTLELAQHADIHSEDNKFNLEALCGLYNISLDAHRADSDAEGCARLALRMADELKINSLRKLADFSQTIDIKEPELPENLDYEDFNKFSHYLQRLSRRQSVQIEDCPFGLDVERTKKILKRNPNAFIDRETATSGYKLSKWLREQEAESTHRRSTAHRKRRYYRK